MQVLELKRLKEKKLKIILVESEFPIDWALELPKEEGILGNLFFVSRVYMEFIKDLVNKYHPNFVVEDKGMRSIEEPSTDDEFGAIFLNADIPYEFVDIPDYALNVVSAPLMDKKGFMKKITEEIESYKKMGRVHYNDPNFQQLIIWKQLLKDDFKAQEDEIRYKVREAWMMMTILELAKKQEKNQLKAFFITDKRHFDGISFLAKELDIRIEIINLKKVAKYPDEETSINDLLNRSILEIMPIKVIKKEKEERILYFFDTDEYCSPFDTNMGYDAGFDIVIPYSRMKADSVSRLVQDAMFSRKAGASSVYFVGGSDVIESEKIAEEVLKTIIPPFESPVIIDPRGSHTTASAIVAKTLEVARKHGFSELSGKKIICLGGTGPVGQISALIASKLNAKVIITSRREQFVKELAKNLTKKAGRGATKIIGEPANSDEQYLKIVRDADIIWSVGKAGVQMISKKLMNQLPPNKIVIDINLVPPYGIEGMKPDYYNTEFYPGIYAIGALNIGRLKYKIERKIFKEALKTKGKKVFDYNIAFEIANKIIFGEEIKILV
ncbi:hypothetical protein ES705_18836 [subsurface metagenome]